MPRLPLRKRAWPQKKNGPLPCPVCGKPWFPWAGSYLPCHGKCLFTAEEQAAIRAHTGTLQQIAKEYGVTISVINSVTRRRGDR